MVSAVLGLYTLSCAGAGVRRRNSSVDSAQMSTFHLRTETESSLRNVGFKKNTMMYNEQNHNNCIGQLYLDISELQTAETLSIYFSHFLRKIRRLSRK
jgi:hypothetical protein